MDNDHLINKDQLIELQRQLALIDLIKDGSGSSLRLLLMRLGYIAIRMRADKNHERAHFHIEYKRQYAASYSIDTLERLAGYMPKKYEQPVLDWAGRLKRPLIATWEKLKSGQEIETMIVVEGDDIPKDRN